MQNITTLFRARGHQSDRGIPAQRMERVRQSFRRRLSDEIEEILYRACVEHDVRTADSLYNVLRELQHRRQQEFGVERRICEDGLTRAAHALERCRALKAGGDHKSSVSG